jgi:hypothetical protein
MMADPLGLDCVYDNGDGTVNIESGDCYSETDNGYYVDCDGCLFDSAGNPYQAVLNQETGALFFEDANGNAIPGINIGGFADPTGFLQQTVTVNESVSNDSFSYSYSSNWIPGVFQTNFTDGDVVCTRKGCLDLSPMTPAKVCQQVADTVAVIGLLVVPEMDVPVWVGRISWGMSSASYLGGKVFCGQ